MLLIKLLTFKDNLLIFVELPMQESLSSISPVIRTFILVHKYSQKNN